MMKRLLPAFFLLLGGLALAAVPSPLEEARAARSAKDYRKALRLLQPMADKGDPDAMVLLGEMYEKGEGVKQDLGESVSWYRKASTKNSAEARYRLAEALFYGRGERQDEKRAVRLYQRAAEQGYAPAQFMVGQLYSQGDFLERSYARAVTWFDKAATQGHAESQYSLGLMYSSGIGLPQQFPHALQWFTLAAEQGHVHAQFLLGAMYASGQGTPKDYVTSCMWMKISLNAGDKEAEEKLPELMNMLTVDDISQCEARAKAKVAEIAGGGRPKAPPKPKQPAARSPMEEANEAYNLRQYDRAIALALPLAEKGDPKAQYFVGVLYDRGYGVPKDMRKALDWMWKAADLGEPPAQFYIAMVNERGESGVPKDEIEGLKWYYLSASGGDEGAAEKLRELEKTLGKGKMRQGSLRAKAWRQAKEKERQAKGEVLPTAPAEKEEKEIGLQRGGDQSGQ